MGPLARLLARQRAHLLEVAAAAAATATAPSPQLRQIAHYAPSAVSGPGGGGEGGVASSTSQPSIRMRATTILAVRLGGEVVLIGDGQATANDFVVKPNVRKLRRLGPVASSASAEATPAETAPPTKRLLSETAASSSPVVAGFAGLAADGLALLDRLDAQVHAHPGQLRRAAVELAKAWRQDRALRELDAAVLVADADATLWLAGNGDVLESADGVVAVGSGSDFAEAAARALIDAAAVEAPRPLTALDVARRAMRVAADSCVYTNHRWTWFRLRREEKSEEQENNGGAPTVVVEEGSEDGLLTSEPKHGGDTV
jgi:ATP-dependent HslUV protease subunit HslV